MTTRASEPEDISINIPESLTKLVYRFLEKEIIEGRFESGVRLIPEELANRLSVSKSPVREALLYLEREGLVTNKPRIGFFVANIKIDDIEEIYPIRASLNALTIRIIIEKGYESDFIPLLEAILSKMEDRVREGDINGFFYLNIQLYDFLLSRCPNDRLTEMLNQLGKQVLRFRRLGMTIPGRIESSLERHKKLVEAIKNMDVLSSTRIAKEIIYGGLEALRSLLGKE